MTDEQRTFEGWAIVEQLGHKRIAGVMREVEIAGHGFLRIDVYAGDETTPSATQFIEPSSVYAITPTTEAIARQVGASCMPQPVQRWELPASTADDMDDDEVAY